MVDTILTECNVGTLGGLCKVKLTETDGVALLVQSHDTNGIGSGVQGVEEADTGRNNVNSELGMRRSMISTYSLFLMVAIALSSVAAPEGCEYCWQYILVSSILPRIIENSVNIP